ncbi:MAG: 6-carboxytetrahydropterin synthase QueD [Candidatus Omnitrophica bacterium]|jgi:6-pyruvoyltetrahydropterin/6-carboxytetrahydropterin synthase|nr:6-carboxytetrahydropterin synthase QueD [Candidatus Omnitrophota bacterium]
MYKIKINSNFSAAHFLRGYQGKCENLHGHNWKVEVVVVSKVLGTSGMVMDFSELKKATSAILEELDHKHLNELPYFADINPSSENIACHIFNKLKEGLKGKDCKLEEISVWETDASCASYKE